MDTIGCGDVLSPDTTELSMHPGILSVGIENGVHWPWPSRSFWPLWRKFYEIWLVCMITCNGFELEWPNLHQICILGLSQLVLQMMPLTLTFKVIWPSFRRKKLHSTLLLYIDLGRPRGYQLYIRASLGCGLIHYSQMKPYGGIDLWRYWISKI